MPTNWPKAILQKVIVSKRQDEFGTVAAALNIAVKALGI